MISSKAKKILEKAFTDALSFLHVASYRYKFVFECPGFHVNDKDVCISDHQNRILYINEEWANKSVSKKELEYDLYFLMAHEARHIYQYVMTERYRKNKPLNEPIKIICAWISNQSNYIRDKGSDTTIRYRNQPLEIDANAFASFFVIKTYNLKATFSKNVEELEETRLYEIAEFYGYSLSPK